MASSCGSFLVVLAFTLAGAGPLHGQVRPDSTAQDSAYTLQELVVRATRPTATTGGVSAVEARLDSMRLPPAPSLEEVARALPLIQIRTNSRGEAQPMLRGAESRQVAILVDGVPLTLGWDHRADLSVVPMAAAETVTLLRGLPSVLHGPNVLGGVVEVGVASGARPAIPPPLRASLAVDHTGARTIGATAARALEAANGRLLLRGGMGYRERSGTALPDGVQAPEPADGRRENSDYEQYDAFLAARYDRDDGTWLSASASGYHAERGVPPELHTAAPRFWRYPLAARLLAAISAGTGMRATPLGEGSLEASIGVDVGRTEIESYASRAYEIVTGTEDADDRMLTFRLLGDHTFGEHAELRMAATLSDIRHDEVIDGGAPSHYRQRLWSVGGEIAWRPPFEGWLADTRITTGVAYDGADTPESADKPPLERLGAWGARLGVNHLAVEGRLMLHAGVSRRARFPSLRELYSGALGRFAPNPDLRPEVLTAAEAGMTARIGDIEVQAVGFRQQLSDVIVRVATEDGRFRRENRDQMRSTGVELLTSMRWGPTALSADVTLQDVTVLDPSTPSGERRPEYQPSLMGKLDWTTALPFGAEGIVAASYVGRQWCVDPDHGRDVAIDPSTRIDVSLGRAFGDFRAELGLDNVRDAAVYDQCGLPQPGRTLRFQIRYR